MSTRPNPLLANQRPSRHHEFRFPLGRKNAIGRQMPSDLRRFLMSVDLLRPTSRPQKQSEAKDSPIDLSSYDPPLRPSSIAPSMVKYS